MKATVHQVIVGVSLLWGALDVLAGAPLRATQILEEIKAVGAKPVFSRLWADESRFDAVCSEIEKGSAEWLEVARQLKPATDAAASLGLNYSVARALPVAPDRVLRLVGHGFQLADICTSPYIEPEQGVAEAYEARALKALATLDDPGLKELALECASKVRLPRP